MNAWKGDAMNAPDPYREEAQATLDRLREEIDGLRQQASLQSGMAQGAGRRGLDDLERRLDVLRDTLNELEIVTEARREGLRQKIDAYSGDLDASIREAWTYYK
jgi:archaellum component FlaC